MGLDSDQGIVLLNESVALKADSGNANHKAGRGSFPDPRTTPSTIRTTKSSKYYKLVIQKDRDGTDHFYSEFAPISRKPTAFRLGPRKSTLGNLPSDETSFPVTTWLKGMLSEGVQQMALNSLLLRRASPPLRTRRFESDGSNLPWVIESLRRQSPDHNRNTTASVTFLDRQTPCPPCTRSFQ